MSDKYVIIDNTMDYHGFKVGSIVECIQRPQPYEHDRSALFKNKSGLEQYVRANDVLEFDKVKTIGINELTVNPISNPINYGKKHYYLGDDTPAYQHGEKIWPALGHPEHELATKKQVIAAAIRKLNGVVKAESESIKSKESIMVYDHLVHDDPCEACEEGAWFNSDGLGIVYGSFDTGLDMFLRPYCKDLTSALMFMDDMGCDDDCVVLAIEL